MAPAACPSIPTRWFLKRLSWSPSGSGQAKAKQGQPPGTWERLTPADVINQHTFIVGVGIDSDS